MIEELTGGTLFQIESQNDYPADYTKTTEVAQQELRTNARPMIIDHVEDMNDYEVVFLGYPNWCGTMPMPAFTFLEDYDFSEKTIVPFCTHEGSGLGQSEKDIAKMCPTATVLKGLAINGSSVGSTKNSVSKWLDKI